MNYKIQDLCEITSSRRIFAREYKNFGIPFYRSQEVIECSLKGNTNPTIFISEERYNEIIKSGLGIPCIGDILMSAIGANRGYPWCVNKVPFYFKDGNVIWLRNFKPFCNSKYLTCFFSTSKCIDMIQKSSEHSAQGAITLDLIKNVQIGTIRKAINREKIKTNLKIKVRIKIKTRPFSLIILYMKMKK